MTKPVATMAADTPERLVRLLPERDVSKLEKELQGVRAKLRWTHLSPDVLEALRLREATILAELAG